MALDSPRTRAPAGITSVGPALGRHRYNAFTGRSCCRPIDCEDRVDDRPLETRWPAAVAGGGSGTGGATCGGTWPAPGVASRSANYRLGDLVQRRWLERWAFVARVDRAPCRRRDVPLLRLRVTLRLNADCWRTDSGFSRSAAESVAGAATQGRRWCVEVHGSGRRDVRQQAPLDAGLEPALKARSLVPA
jgi:hypothetical protein